MHTFVINIFKEAPAKLQWYCVCVLARAPRYLLLLLFIYIHAYIRSAPTTRRKCEFVTAPFRNDAK